MNMITDKKAEELEQRGLWRRAAARWQELLLNYLQEDDGSVSRDGYSTA
ncbi:PerC family transcriptional regulator [Escherichia coli]|nr:PerC family transcriptional regulator [Escherichia coli]